jgi:hypothetical protein
MKIVTEETVTPLITTVTSKKNRFQEFLGIFLGIFESPNPRGRPGTGGEHLQWTEHPIRAVPFVL